jgi:DNA-binding GntR family transcriptional regulator
MSGGQFEGSTSAPYVTSTGTDAWAAEAASRGQVGGQRLVEVATIESPENVRGALGLTAVDHVVVRRRLVLADDRPVEIATSYYPAAIAADTPLAGSGKIRGGAVAALAALGYTATDVDEEITARWPNAAEMTLLGVDEHEPLLVLSRTSRNGDGRAFEHAVNCMVARLSPPVAYRLRVAG